MAQDREASGHLLMPAIVPLRPRRWAGSGPAAVRNERRPAPGLSTGASCAQVTGGGTGEETLCAACRLGTIGPTSTAPA